MNSSELEEKYLPRIPFEMLCFVCVKFTNLDCEKYSSEQVYGYLLRCRSCKNILSKIRYRSFR